MNWLISLFIFCLPLFTSGQYNWKPEKDKDGIKVFLSDLPNSSFKAIKVECTLNGEYSKLISILLDVEHFKDWIYNNKKSILLKTNKPLDFIYYSETHMPWPMSNRDVVIHLRISTENLPKYLLIEGENVKGFVPESSSRVRVPHYKASWKVTMPTAGKLFVNYIVEIDPGGNIPAWAANMFADKGPFGSFSKLSELLEK